LYSQENTAIQGFFIKKAVKKRKKPLLIQTGEIDFFTMVWVKNHFFAKTQAQQPQSNFFV
jgi:hypothetical protein